MPDNQDDYRRLNQHEAHKGAEAEEGVPEEPLAPEVQDLIGDTVETVNDAIPIDRLTVARVEKRLDSGEYELIDRDDARFPERMNNVVNDLFDWYEDVAEARERGINLDRAQSYVEGLGLKFPETMFYTDDDLDTINAIFAKHGLESFNNFGVPNRIGGYDVILDISLIKRVPEIERENGAFETERTAVHEAVHGSDEMAKQLMLFEEDGTLYVTVPHLALADISESGGPGRFLEEATAEKIAGDYAVKHTPQRHLNRIAKKSGKKPLKRRGNYAKMIAHEVGPHNSTLHVPFRYIGFDRTGNLGFSYPHYAAAGLDWLIQREDRLRQRGRLAGEGDESLLDLLLEAKKSNRDDLPEVRNRIKRRIDIIGGDDLDDLYDFIMQIPATNENFASGLAYIQAVLRIEM